jgi:hypothetical protein
MHIYQSTEQKEITEGILMKVKGVPKLIEINRQAIRNK